MLKNIVPRLYQETIFSKAVNKNTLVVLPTGLGKTAIAMMMAQHRLQAIHDSKILMIAPTKPLVEQHLETFKKHFEKDASLFAMFTGEISPEKREKMWKEAQFIFSTPQGLENDIISNRISLKEISLVIFDEAHRAVGDYAYNFIAKQYNQKASYPRILALTASPGSDLMKITEICNNLGIENIEVKTESDPDVKQYVQEIDVDWVKVDLPPSFLFIKKT
ncbi:MAG TPA: DEAD/DEAH box helicase, partial [Candidatus Nanoarchaeia archaeon]|nr:DEAD/DEAH box helicase [Candidatus Nanoarchaeia archaeon]